MAKPADDGPFNEVAVLVRDTRVILRIETIGMPTDYWVEAPLTQRNAKRISSTLLIAAAEAQKRKGSPS